MTLGCVVRSQGSFALIGYDGGGERTGEEYGAETIALLWPSVGQGFQDVMGLLFEFKYGEFGTIKNESSNHKVSRHPNESKM